MTLIIGNLEPSTSAFDAEPSTAQCIGAILTMIDGLSSKVAFYCYDANGNVTDLIGTNGSFLAQYQYDPYGNTLSKSGDLADVNPFQFSTKYTDSETGLLYYGHRFYSANLSRWINRDPLNERGGRHLYRFVDNHPISRYDQLGMCSMGVGYSSGVILQTMAECGEKCGLRPGTKAPVPACAICDYKLEAKCYCVAKDKWTLDVSISGGCTTFIASAKLPVIWDPNYDAVYSHEKCHCKDCADMASQACKDYSVKYPSTKTYTSESECNVDKGLVELDMSLRMAQVKTSVHKGRKWEPGGECYATGDFE